MGSPGRGFNAPARGALRLAGELLSPVASISPSPSSTRRPQGDGFMLKRIACALAFVAAAVWLWTTSWLAPKPPGAPRLIAHRGVHQTYNREGLTNETCTAKRIHPPEHGLIEN